MRELLQKEGKKEMETVQVVPYKDMKSNNIKYMYGTFRV